MASKAPRVTIYKDHAGEWRWRLTAANGEIVAQGEGHTTRYNAERAAVSARLNFEKAWLYDDEA